MVGLHSKLAVHGGKKPGDECACPDCHGARARTDGAVPVCDPVTATVQNLQSFASEVLRDWHGVGGAVVVGSWAAELGWTEVAEMQVLAQR